MDSRRPRACAARELVLAVGLAVVLPGASGHALLTEFSGARANRFPIGRDSVVKLTPFGDANKVANGGCGGIDNQPPGSLTQNLVQQPGIVVRPGREYGIAWEVTIPHDIDIEDTGVRVAIHYSPQDSFSDNVLLEGAKAHEVGDPAGTIKRRLITIPEGKTCAFCTLQWMWAARNDGGFYISCVDIAITDDGVLPDYDDTDKFPSQVGNEVAGKGNINANVVDGNGDVISTGEDSGGGNAAAIAAGVIIGLLVLGCLVFFVYKRSKSGGGMLPNLKRSAPPPGDAGLPPGWGSAVDPASGRMYYVNSATGATSWEPPLASPRDAKGAPPTAAALPPGWTSSVDPASGQTYFVNSITGVTQWEPPAGRV